MSEGKNEYHPHQKLLCKNDIARILQQHADKVSESQYELPTSDILEILLDPSSNKKCFVPVITDHDEIKMVLLKNWEDLETNFKPNKWNILEPIDKREQEKDLYLIICPGRAIFI